MTSTQTEFNKGDWVEITSEILKPAERAANLPQDTAEKPYTLRMRGIAEESGTIGQTVTIRTMTGRQIQGIAVTVNPYDAHSFGKCIPELIHTRINILATMRGKYNA